MSQRPTPQRRLPAVIPDGGGPAGTVVVGLDGSATSWDAFWWAAGEARRSGRSLVAVFVRSVRFIEAISAATGIWIDQPMMWQATDQQATELQKAATETAHKLGLDLRFVHAHGDAAAELLAVARSTLADLIVVGRSAHPLHQLVGSTAKRLAGSRGAPVVVIVP